jgi:hypothetical protein
MRAEPTRDAAPADASLAGLAAAVQHNCDLGDALHARDGALCTYLLAMRELYRWSAGAALGATLDRASVGGWIAAHESAWDRLCADQTCYRDLPIDGGVDPFDDASADAAFAQRGLVYGAGIGPFGAPVFFLAERLREERRDGAAVVVAGAEFARGLVAPPAASRNGRIVVRTDALRRWLWTRLEGGPQRPRPGAFAALIEGQGGRRADAIERFVQEQTETLILHELGEVRVAALLGADWERMLADGADRQTEVVLRAVRDLLADCLVTLPVLLDRAAADALRFWYAAFEGARRVLAPRLARLHASIERGDPAPLEALCMEEGAHWLRVVLALRDRWRAGGAPALRHATRVLLQEAQPS